MNCCWFYQDEDFPPNAKSLGNISGDKASGTAGKTTSDIIWMRLSEFDTTKSGTQLFRPETVGNEIKQGRLGDCWLLSAMICLAEHRGAITRLFCNKELDPRGRYRVRLFDGQRRKWVNVEIDDYIPCDRKIWEDTRKVVPAFAQADGQLWVQLMEKAFAKFCGSYANLEGGWTSWGMRAMTGDLGRRFKALPSGKWQRLDLLNVADATDKKKAGFYSNPEEIEADELFKIMFKYYRLQSVLCCSGASGKVGLVSGHAYAILDILQVGSHCLLRIRNPWGHGEWKGNWSDKSDLWQKHPDVASAAKKFGEFKGNDGIFWMSWKDFVSNWEYIGVVHRTVDVRSLSLEMHGDGCFSPAAACFRGCGLYWCCCEGVCRLYCPETSENKTVELTCCDKRCPCCHTS